MFYHNKWIGHSRTKITAKGRVRMRAGKIVLGSLFALVALADGYSRFPVCELHPMIDCFTDYSVEIWSVLSAVIALILLGSAFRDYIWHEPTSRSLGFDNRTMAAIDQENTFLGSQNRDSYPHQP